METKKSEWKIRVRNSHEGGGGRGGELFQTIYHCTVYFDGQVKNNRTEQKKVDLNRAIISLASR